MLHDACREAGLASASLWAAVPHYVSLAPSPRAARALVDRLGVLLEAEIDTAELAEAEESYATAGERGRRRATRRPPPTSRSWSAARTRVEEISEENLPSGDSLAAELTRFLRQHDASRTTTARGRASSNAR